MADLDEIAAVLSGESGTGAPFSSVYASCKRFREGGLVPKVTKHRAHGVYDPIHVARLIAGVAGSSTIGAATTAAHALEDSILDSGSAKHLSQCDDALRQMALSPSDIAEAGENFITVLAKLLSIARDDPGDFERIFGETTIEIDRGSYDARIELVAWPTPLASSPISCALNFGADSPNSSPAEVRVEARFTARLLARAARRIWWSQP